MDKKKIWIIVLASVVVAAVIGIAIFLIVTRSVKPSSQGGAPESIDGTWSVAAFTPNVVGDTPVSYTPNQEMVFENGNFSYYQNGTVIATAKYTFTSGAKDYSSTVSVPHYRCALAMTEQSTQAIPSAFVVKYYSANVIELVDETAGKMWRLAHIDGTRTEHKKVTAEYLQKKWTVLLKGYEAPEMTLEFSADKAAIKRAQGDLDLPYTFDAENSVLNIPGFGVAHLYIPADNMLVFAVEEANPQNGVTMWELKVA